MTTNELTTKILKNLSLIVEEFKKYNVDNICDYKLEIYKKIKIKLLNELEKY